MNPAKTTWFYGEERFAEILSFVADARSRGERRNVAHERYMFHSWYSTPILRCGVWNQSSIYVHLDAPSLVAATKN